MSTPPRKPRPDPEDRPIPDDVRHEGHSHSPGMSQAGAMRGSLDRGVDPEHLRSSSQGARPEDESLATPPDQGEVEPIPPRD